MTVWRLLSCIHPYFFPSRFSIFLHGHSMEYDFMRHGDDGYTISILFHFFLEIELDIVSRIGLLMV
jgi:hypothetical protein